MLWFAIFALLLMTFTGGSHFRGAIIMREPKGPNTVTINYRIAWRLTWNSDTFCNNSVINSNKLIGIDAMSCFSGCTGTVGLLRYQCTDYSPMNLEDWSTGRGSVTFTSKSPSFTIGFASCCWISLNSGGSGWSLQATVNLKNRTDTGRINTSPTVDFPMLFRLQNRCNHTFYLPVNDVDGDEVRCRWAKGNECSGVCESFPGATLISPFDQRGCKITYVPRSTVAGYYAVAIQVEDFETSTSTVPLSSVPFQFLVYVYNTAESCGSVPAFVPPTPNDGECFSLDVGDDFGITITARSNRSLQSIGTTSAIGMKKSSEVKSNDSHWYYISANITWIPQPEDGGKEHTLCFYAVDVLGLTSPVRCLKIPVSVKGPSPLRVERVGVSNTWIIVLDQLFEQPKEPAFIRVYQTLTNKEIISVDVSTSKDVVYNSNARQINVTFNYNFDVDEKYHVTIPSGLVQGLVNCHAVSIAIEDSTFWKVEIDCGSLDLKNGGEHAPNGTAYPNTVKYTCNPGYDLAGDDTRTCLVNRTWTGVEPQCIPKDCGSYTTPHFGSAVSSPVGSTLFNTTVRFYCNIGHTMIGVTSMVCDVEGNWNNIPPSCLITDCGSLSAPENGMIQASATVYGAVVKYSCKTGYKLSGDSTRHCLASGKWNGSEPECSLIDCGPLQAPENGQLLMARTIYGSSVRFECDEGYELVGDNSGVCKEDGWSIDTPVCQLKEETQYDDDCSREHGVCTTHIYENVRLRALKSSGCKKFCQCAHASTQMDGSVTYYWQEQDCPPGTLFDDSLPAPVCVHAFMTKCPTVQRMFEVLPTTNSPYTTMMINSPELYGGNRNLCEIEHGVCNWITYQDSDNRIVALKSSQCQQFCLCAHAPVSHDGSQGYYWVDLKCPPGTLFDDNVQPHACNHANSVKC